MRKIAENIAATLPNLVLNANKIAESVWAGIYSKKKTGPGEAFWQFRKYEQGDPAHLIDWRKTAKTNEAYIQERELETIQNIVLWRDTSDSMNYCSNKNYEKKIDRANLIILALSIILSKSGENISLNGHEEKSMRGKLAVDFIAQEIYKNADNAYRESPSINNIKNNSLVILVGDFLTPLSKLEEDIKKLVNKNIHAVFIHIFDPSEKSLPYKGRVNFKSEEHKTSVMIGNVESIKNDYLEKFNTHYNKFKEIIHSYSWNYISHGTNKSATDTVRKIYHLISNKTKLSKIK